MGTSKKGARTSTVAARTATARTPATASATSAQIVDVGCLRAAENGRTVGVYHVVMGGPLRELVTR